MSIDSAGVPRFFIIDQSLCNAAGHHFDYTRNLSLAASEKQYQTVVGANRDFNDSDPGLFAAAAIRNCFANTTYSSLSELHGLRSLTRSPQPPQHASENDGWLAGRRYNKHARLRARYVEQFLFDCQAFFGDSEFTADDQVFFVTVSELECEGLARFISETPSAKLAHWHLQFHFELYDGAGDTNEIDQRLEHMKPLFLEIQNQLPNCVFFYATSVGLSRQYNRLGTFRFETLAYPVNAGFFEHRSSEHRKIQVGCFGGIRREKGLKTLGPKLVEALENDADVRDKIELVVQGKPSELSPKAIRDSDVIRWVPMPAGNYTDLVHDADIGLLFYDRVTFANRVSSTLNEFLCAGKPVIVSNASWLHEKIMPAIAEYQLAMFERSKVVWSSVDAESAEASSVTIPLDGFEKPHRLICIKGRAVSRVSERMGASPRLCMDAVEIGRPIDDAIAIGPGASAHPLTVAATTFFNGEPLETKTEVVSNTEQNPILFACCLDMPADTDQVELQFSFAGDVTGVEVGVFESDHPIPKSQVGIALAEEDDVFAAIKHLSEHLDHFQHSAAEFSKQIETLHRPATTFEQLLRRSANEAGS